MHVQVGKIKSLTFGAGGYQDAMLGFTFQLGGDGWGTQDFKGTWRHHSKSCKWTPESQRNHLGESCLTVSEIMSDAKVSTLAELIDKPVEVTFTSLNGTMQSWRILKEVL